jgi:hydroxypyruvate isomerase
MVIHGVQIVFAHVMSQPDVFHMFHMDGELQEEDTAVISVITDTEAAWDPLRLDFTLKGQE